MLKRFIVLVSALMLVGCSEVNQDKSDVTTSSNVASSSGKSQKKSEYDVVLTGDLTPFVGEFSTDEFNQMVVDSDFSYGGYTSEDYFEEKTSVFPSITPNGYWNGIVSHGSFEIVASDLPYKQDDYYVVRVHGVNSGANNNSFTFNLVPPNVAGPDGTVSKERRVFRVDDGDVTELIYQKKKWWENYSKQQTEIDLDIVAINSGDFSTLAGTWENGKGDILIIHDDGTTNLGMSIMAVPDSDKTSKIPYASTGAGALGLFKIGFENPDGDRSDTSRPRLVMTQSAGDYEPDFYYYRQQ